MSKYQALIDALNGDNSLFSNVRNGDVRALLADLERAEKALATLAQQAQEPVQADAPRSCPDACRTPEKCCNFGCQKATPPAPQVPAPVDERAEFEVWARPNGYDMRRNDVLGHYRSIDTLRAWTGWQARAALQSPAPQTGRWLPIASAPRGSGENGPRSVNDPAYVQPPDLLLIHTEGISVGYYDWYYHPGYGVGASQYEPVWRSRPDGAGLDGVTHWMPLPAAPKTKGQP